MQYRKTSIVFQSNQRSYLWKDEKNGQICLKPYDFYPNTEKNYFSILLGKSSLAKSEVQNGIKVLKSLTV